MSRLSALIIGIALLASACGGSDSASSEATEVTTATDDVTADSTDSDSAGAESPESDFEFTPIGLQPTEAGPRPLLEWEAIDGADEYYVVVLGSDGTPYWAWSGVSTSIHVGGVEDPEGIGAWVGEPMTWSVSALDADGKVLGLSSSADLIP